MLLYHHCRSLNSIVYGEVTANPEFFDSDFKDAYLWLGKEVGFYPVFLAVGATEEDIRMTGYQNQWRKLLSEEPNGKKFRKRGEFPNDILFSFENVKGIFMDYDYWHLALNAGYKNYQLTNYEKRLIFKPSWSKSRWLRRAEKNPHLVQLVVESLYLPSAKKIWVRNQQTKNSLASIGFENIEVKKLLLEKF